MSHWPNYKFMFLRKALSPKITSKLSDASHNFFSRFIETYEAAGPNIRTQYESHTPETALNLKMINFNQSAEHIDLKNSFGNYFQDTQGNTILDMFMDNGRNSFGYNSRRWIKDTKFQKYERYLYQRPAIGVLPSVDYPKLLHELIEKIGPEGLHEIYLSCGCGSSANINALKLAFLKKFFELKGTDKITPEEERTILIGEEPGAPKFSVIGFQGGYHGKFLELLSLTSSKNTYSFVPKHNWPIAPFPILKFPYEENLTHNRAEETRCVEITKNIIKEHKNPIAAMIIEPLQLLGGVRYASNVFYKDLIDLCYDNNIAFICDETNTSGWASGRPFMHTSWNSEKPVHMVTFGGRMQIAGVFYQKQFRPKYGNMINSTWNGDIVKLLQFFDTYDQITRVDWIDAHSEQFWQCIKSELLDLQKRARIPISNIRGIGKIFAFDVEHKMLRDEIVFTSRASGYKVNAIGDLTIAFTPSLLFTEVHFSKYKNFLMELIPGSLNMHALNYY